jgi:hypothetical protein
MRDFSDTDQVQQFERLVLSWARRRLGPTTETLHDLQLQVERAASVVTGATSDAVAAEHAVNAAATMVARAQETAASTFTILHRRGAWVLPSSNDGSELSFTWPAATADVPGRVVLAERAGKLTIRTEGNIDPTVPGLLAGIAGTGRWDLLPALLPAIPGDAGEGGTEEEAHATRQAFIALATSVARCVLDEASRTAAQARQQLASETRLLQEATARQTAMLQARRALELEGQRVLDEAHWHYRLLQSLPGVTGIEVGASALRVSTSPIRVAHGGVVREIGPFVIEIAGPTGPLRLLNLANRRPGHDAYDHPHVAAGLPALGSAQEEMARALGEGDLAGVVLGALEFLRSYTPHRAYVPLEEWPLAETLAGNSTAGGE